jgi:hypothetical protein
MTEPDLLEFTRLAVTWKTDDRLSASSNLRDYKAHPAAQAMIKMGPGIVPYILKDWKHDPVIGGQ